MNNKKPLKLCALTAIMLGSLSACVETKSPTAEAITLSVSSINPSISDCNTTSPQTAITSALIGTPLPCVASLPSNGNFGLQSLQQSFDFYSWLTFLSLNAPAAGGNIGGADAPTVWSRYKEISDVMRPQGQAPTAWGQPHEIPAVCQHLSSDSAIKVLSQVGKTPNVLNEFGEPFDTGPLIDQNGKYVRYEILMNKVMFDYIVSNNLYSKAGQVAFNQEASFPIGNVPNPATSTTGTMGAIMVKAAWKVMGAGDDSSKFHTVESLVYTPASTVPAIAESCSLQTMGLVGFHVGHKTSREPQWLWSTFEHADNVPSQDDVTQNNLQAHYNFYKPNCTTGNCTVNTAPPRPWDPNIEPFPNGYKSQITRVLPITPEVNNLNRDFSALLPGSVFRHYRLISTQWPTAGNDPTDPSGQPAPRILANSTLESYIQGHSAATSSSCIGCHLNATQTNGTPSDFTYILERAQ